MIASETILQEIAGVSTQDLERWIDHEYIQAEGAPGGYRFHEIDVARIQLIVTLRETLEVDEAALPTVLHLLDQLYDLRRRLRRMNGAFGAMPPDLRAELKLALASALVDAT
jgi:chaperone modulatory protein CbpM